jgi:hypothetical protein
MVGCYTCAMKPAAFLLACLSLSARRGLRLEMILWNRNGPCCNRAVQKR